MYRNIIKSNDTNTQDSHSQKVAHYTEVTLLETKLNHTQPLPANPKYVCMCLCVCTVPEVVGLNYTEASFPRRENQAESHIVKISASGGTHLLSIIIYQNIKRVEF